MRSAISFSRVLRFLALLVQGVFELVERALTPRGLRLVARQ